MRRHIIFFILLYFMTIPFFSFAQEQNDSLEGNLAYRSLKIERDSLMSIQTSLKDEIDKYKGLSETDLQKKDEYVSQVLQLENKLFDIRNKIGVVSSKCSAIEQEYIIKNLNKKPANTTIATAQKLNANTNILHNKFIVENLSAEEIKIMSGCDTIDALVLHLRDSIKIEQEIIKDIDTQLRNTQESTLADSLLNLVEVNYKRVENYEEQLTKAWGEMFETKIYAYTRLLDKLNVSVDVLSKLSGKHKEVRTIAEMADTAKFSSIFYTYPIKRELILSYEKLLAEKLVYMSAIDSIERKIEDVKTLQCDYPNVILPEWEYVHFEGAKIGGSGVHSVARPVTNVKIPTHGTVYMIRFATLTNKLSQISALRKVNPVVVFPNEVGKYEYYAGIYQTLEQAEADLSKIKNAGFNPVVVEWRNGGKVYDKETIIPLNVADYYYCVQFDEVTPEITSKLKSVAPNKELLRIDDKYSVGFFKNYLEVMKVKKVLGGQSIIVPVKIEED